MGVARAGRIQELSVGNDWSLGTESQRSSGAEPLFRISEFQGRAPQGRRKELESGGDMASAGARAYNGGLGALGVEPPAGSRGRAPGQGVRGASPPEADAVLALRHPQEGQNRPPRPVSRIF